MKIFVSYGHTDYPNLINRFIQDLQKKYNVWTDKQLQLGQKWASEIDDSIDACDIFIFLLASGSIRRDGYCLGEVTRAKDKNKTIVVVKLDDVKLPSLVAQDQYFSMQNCIDIDDSIDNELYTKRFEEFQSNIEKLFQKANDTEKTMIYHFDNDKHVELLLKSFVGRKWIKNYFDEFNFGEKRVMLISGEAGSGKSCISAYIYQQCRHNSSIHFCSHHDVKSFDIHLMLQSIAFDLGNRFENFKNYLDTVINHENRFENMDSHELFNILFTKPFSKLTLSGEFYVIIDGLDEIPKNYRKSFFSIIKNRFLELPDNIKYIYTTRNDSLVINSIMSLDPYFIRDINEKNEEDIILFISRSLEQASIKYDMISIKKIISQSGGDFLYVKFILDELIIRKTFDVTKVEFPIGMKGVCQNYFDRLFDDENEEYLHKIRPFLEVLCASKEPLSINFIEEILSSCDYELHMIVKHMSMFLVCKDNKINLSHKSLYDWLCSMSYDDPYYINVKNGAKVITEWIVSSMLGGNLNDYINRYGFLHIVELGRVKSIIDILKMSSERILDVFIMFINKLVMDRDYEKFNNIFYEISISKLNSNRIVLSCIKNLIQYGKNQEARSILQFLTNDNDYGLLKDYYDFIQEKSKNKSTIKLIKKGEILLNEAQIDEKTKADLARTIGDAYRENGSHQKAVNLYNYAKDLCGKDRQCNTYYDSECALIDMQYVYGNIPAAFEMLETLKSRIDTSDYNITRYKYERLQGNLYHSLHDIEKSLKCFEDSLEIAQNIGFPLKVIEAKNSIAELLGDHVRAFQLLEEARDMCKMLDMNSLEYGKSFYIESAILILNGDLRTAVKKAELSCSLLSDVGYGSGIARAKFIKAMALYELNQFDSAITLFYEALLYYTRENIYPSHRIDCFYYVIKCAERIGKLSEYKSVDSLQQIQNKQYFEFMNDKLKYIEETICNE